MRSKEKKTDLLMRDLFSDLDSALFDLDGTLVETNIDFQLMKSEMVDFAARHGIDADELLGLDILAIVEKTSAKLSANSGEKAAQAAKKEALDVLEKIELRHAASAQEVPPARELIAELRNRGIAVGIVTRNCRAASEESIARAGIHPDVLLCREDVERTKPSPDQLLTALEMLKVKPERSIMIGDHLMDVIAGKAAGMKTIGVLTPGRADDFFDKVDPDAVARNLGEILSAFIDHHS